MLKAAFPVAKKELWPVEGKVGSSAGVRRRVFAPLPL